ncbi:hypothetical protein [Oricola sp.]|uniref:hypothetical protein n=1 Tax=Oricola sp. TaxID=1979950 RepID=UPI0025E42A83|nr:hypothetical protein [Oricola sp.]MCI5077248.1 SH3 domain-containing protein [Oricola sp.]
MRQVSAVIFLFWATAAHAVDLSKTCVEVYGVVADDVLWIRTCPDADCRKADFLNWDQQGVLLGECQGNWCQIMDSDTREVSGWSSSRYLRLDRDCNIASRASESNTHPGDADQVRPLPDDQLHIQVASRQDLGEAIVLAREYKAEFEGVRLFQSKNGWYAIVIDTVRNGAVQATLARLRMEGKIPADSYATRGESFVRSIDPDKPSMHAAVEVMKNTSVTVNDVIAQQKAYFRKIDGIAKASGCDPNTMASMAESMRTLRAVAGTCDFEDDQIDAVLALKAGTLNIRYDAERCDLDFLAETQNLREFESRDVAAHFVEYICGYGETTMNLMLRGFSD